jgi:hypothetical protein
VRAEVRRPKMKLIELMPTENIQDITLVNVCNKVIYEENEK